MNLEPIPIGTPAPFHPAAPPTETIFDRVSRPRARAFGLGVSVGIVLTFAVGLLFVLARENEWHDRLQKQHPPTPDAVIAPRR